MFNILVSLSENFCLVFLNVGNVFLGNCKRGPVFDIFLEIVNRLPSTFHVALHERLHQGFTRTLIQGLLGRERCVLRKNTPRHNQDKNNYYTNQARQHIPLPVIHAQANREEERIAIALGIRMLEFNGRET